MHSPVFKNLMVKLLTVQTLPSSQLPATVRDSTDWKNWLAAGFVEAERRGACLSFRVLDREALREIFHQKFPGEATNDGSAVDNLRAFGDSKARIRLAQGVCFLRGQQAANVNGRAVDVGEITQHFGVFAAVLRTLHCDWLCLVENLDIFLQAERVVGDDWLLLHAYGRVGKEGLQKIHCRKMLVFSDYDFVGLEEFLRVQEVFPEARFFMPEHYDALWSQYAKPLKKRDSGEQVITRRVRETRHPVVASIREQLLRTGRFLEQQALFL